MSKYKNINMEILAPVGGSGQLTAAVRCGADAVYLGASLFNARRNAENFSDENLRDIVSYCHSRDVKVYITVNTLVMDQEKEDLIAQAKCIADSGADAVIIQDLAVNALFRDCCPGLRRHASTQMLVHNISGAKMAKELGFQRVVLARELSLREIWEINSAVDIETEVFVHGALCMCVSGGCYLSSLLGERSGNRGLCAQPCRLNFRSSKGREYALSLRDLCALDMVRELREAGVSSLKIEGRMKRPEYVGAAVTACRQALSGAPYDAKRLQAVFSRSGFTDGYLRGKRNLSMFGYRRKEDVTAASPVLRELASLYKDEPRTVPVNMTLKLKAGCPAELEASCPKPFEHSEAVLSAVSFGPEPQTAFAKPLTEELAVKNLGKTGDTPFYLKEFTFSSQPELMLPSSALNALRRDALNELLNKRGSVSPHRFLIPFENSNCGAKKKNERPERWLRFERREQFRGELAQQADRLLFPLSELYANPELLRNYAEKIIGELPSLAFPEYEKSVFEQAEILKSRGLNCLWTDNLYGIKLAESLNLPLCGGWGLNVLNSKAAAEYEALGLIGLTASFELSLHRLRKMKTRIPTGMIAYGHLPLMRMRACPVQSEKGCASCKGTSELTDRRGYRFPLLCTEKRYVTLLNSLPLYLADKDISRVDFHVYWFTRETPVQCQEILDAYREKKVPEAPRTCGLYFRELK